MTEAAFNALLKTLEEPPAHVIFMMATTEPENIPQTIRSRCQHFSFHAVKFDDILAQLKAIAAQENVAAVDEALALLAEAGDGSMRDALSIMDQAIASAPLEDGRPKLAVEQIRELMGSVPSTVFEKLLEAVAVQQSAVLMEHLNVLLNCGHSPLSLARQMVRYLRNSLMAKIGGEQTELLAISFDERARAARTALLFTEEELTRNLQIVLRTFDDLNYRQEQRFHLELGLLKLIHAQRLLPIEELLSGVSAGGGPRAGAPVSMSRGTGSMARPAGASSVSASAPRQEPSGWNASPAARQNTSGSGGAAMSRSDAAVDSAVTARIAAPQLSPFPAVGVQTRGSATAEELTEGALAKAPEAAQAAGDGLSADSIRQDIVAALAMAGHSSAA
ncbi:MAG: DNA polymerase III subunit gamma/tau, partial [Terracidiphilus sp.]